MPRSGLEGLIVPLIDLLLLGRRVVALRLALVKADLKSRASSLVIALVLALLAVVLLLVVIVLGVQAALIGFASLGLTPLQSLLAAAAACLVIAGIFLLIARSCLRRATLPLTSLARTGENLPKTRP